MPLGLGCGALLWASCLDYGFQPAGSRAHLDDQVGSVGGEHPLDLHIAQWCDLPAELSPEVANDETCMHEVQLGPLSASVEWQVRTFQGGYGEHSQVVMAPVVGQLTDDNGDGRVDRDDDPDIVVVTDDDGFTPQHKGILRVLSGRDGTPMLTVERMELDGLQAYPYRYSNVALGDVDGDGSPELVLTVLVLGQGGGDGGGEEGGSSEDTADPGGDDGGGDTSEPGDTDNPIGPAPPAEAPPQGDQCTVAAVELDGSLAWLGTGPTFTCGGHAPSLADLEGDGTVEVVLGAMVFEGGTGALRFAGTAGQGRYAAYAELGLHSIVVDLDGDGVQEIIAGPTLYGPDGSVRCTAEAPPSDGFTAAADLDLDGMGEVVLVGDGQVAVYEADCTVVRRWSLVGSGTGGPPTIGDFDADGWPEVGIADADTYSVYEPMDGTARWSHPVQDASSHATGSVVFDFEGDGVAEVLYADETRLWVLSGPDGAVRLESTTHASRTLHEYPTVADLDHDGSTEIIVPHGGGHQGEGLTGLTIFGNKDNTWTSSRQVWNQHAYSITNVDDDLGIPSPGRANWPGWNTFRSGDVHPLSGGASSDAVPLAATCLLECEANRIVLSVAAGNAGASPLRGGLPISVYTGTPEAPVHLETLWTTEVAEPGSRGDTLVFRVELDTLVAGGLGIRVDDDAGVGYVAECSEDNNLLWLEDPLCP